MFCRARSTPSFKDGRLLEIVEPPAPAYPALWQNEVDANLAGSRLFMLCSAQSFLEIQACVELMGVNVVHD